ncbi:hypothetical protein BDV96DRAFT_568379 [Lophiotrema nucula]|uniref:Uncharacterized protein n=1 Tax=Lophiotrema nucula TaxID=690887 RepID=A0A6A5ZKE4_9PLEO|nr:hypothetical protein BDV96DRAFT_568379 [Lophiotrema nucula]
MADPLSITASVLAVVGAGIKVSIALFTLVETVSTASRRVEAIANDIQSTCGILDQLSALVEARIEGRRILNARALGDVKGELRNCKSVFREIEKYLRRATKQVDGIGRSLTLLPGSKKKKRLELSRGEKAKWPFLQPHFGELRSDLRDSKQNLTLMIVVANYRVLLMRSVVTNDEEEEKEKLRDQIVVLHQRTATGISRRETMSFESESEKENAVRKLFRKMNEWRRREKSVEEGARELNEKQEEDGENTTAQSNTNIRHAMGPEQTHQTIPEVDENQNEGPAAQISPADISPHPQPETQKLDAVELEGAGRPGTAASGAASGDLADSIVESEGQLEQPDSSRNIVESPRAKVGDGGQGEDVQVVEESENVITHQAMGVGDRDSNSDNRMAETVENAGAEQISEAHTSEALETRLPSLLPSEVEANEPSVASPVEAALTQIPIPVQTLLIKDPQAHLAFASEHPSRSAPTPPPIANASNEDEDDGWGAWSGKPKPKKKAKKTSAETKLSLSAINVVAETVASRVSDPAPPWSFSGGTTKLMSKKGKQPIRDLDESDEDEADDEEDDDKVLSSTTETFHVDEERVQQLLRAWTTGATPGLHDGKARALTIHELRLPKEDIQALLEEHKDGSRNPFKSIFKLNAYQRRLVLEHVAAVDSTLLYVDIWGQEQMSTVFGVVEIAVLMWVTSTPADKQIDFDSDTFLVQKDTTSGLSAEMGVKARSGEAVRRGISGYEDPLEQRVRVMRFEEETRRARQEAVAKSDSGEAAQLLEAASKAREDAEARAAKEAQQIKTAYEKSLAEAKAAAEELEKAKKAAEEEAEKLKPSDAPKLPIKFKDAVGRKFSFPWHLVKTWKGMEELINQAFLHVDVIGPHVHEGHYDLVGPSGEIILPQVWESMIQPDMAITMHMWPMPEAPAPPKDVPAPPSSNKSPPPPPPPPPGTTIIPPAIEIVSSPKSREQGRKPPQRVNSWISSMPPPPPPPPPPPGASGHKAPPSSFTAWMGPGAKRTKSKVSSSQVPSQVVNIPPPPPPPPIWDASSTSSTKKKSKPIAAPFMKWAAGAGPGPSKILRTQKMYDKMADSDEEPEARVEKKEGKKKHDGIGGGEGGDVVEKLLLKWTDDVEDE